MAFVETRPCSRCGEVKNITSGSGDLNTVCGDCRQEERKSKRDRHFDELDGMTLEQRVRQIEEWIYDYKVPIDPTRVLY